VRPLLVLLAVAATGCIDDLDPRWTLSHDHVIAVRATPPAVLPGESAELDALLAHDSGPATVEAPTEAAALEAPASLEGLVYTDAGKWFVFGPSEDTLVAARIELGLPAGAPVPLDVYTAYPRDGAEPMFAKKRVWLGISAHNPPSPVAAINGAPMPIAEPGDFRAREPLVVPDDGDTYFSTTVDTGWRVNWLSSCGTLFQDDVATAFLRVLDEDPREGELAVVVRDPDGGVAWRVWPIVSE
jgi:hypothetical protein